MNQIDIEPRVNEHQGEYPAIVIDGVALGAALDAWCGQLDGPAIERFDGLVTALYALANDDARDEAASASLEPTAATRIVPLLVCPDSCDLECTVVVAEVASDAELVRWLRVGVMRGEGLRMPQDPDVDWLAGVPPLTFDASAYRSTMRRLVDAPRLWARSIG